MPLDPATGQAIADAPIPGLEAIKRGVLGKWIGSQLQNAPDPSIGGPLGMVSIGEQAIKPLYQHSPEELNSLYQTAKSSDSNMLKNFFGEEGAKTYNQAQRSANSYLNPDKADKASQLIEQMEGNLTKDQQNQLYGINQPEHMNPERIKEYQEHLGRLDFSSPEALGDSLKWAVGGVGPNPNPQMMNSEQQLRYAQIRHAYEEASRLGWDPKVISSSALKGAANRYGADAPYMLQHFFKGK